jgi:hypothetical protein
MTVGVFLLVTGLFFGLHACILYLKAFHSVWGPGSHTRRRSQTPKHTNKTARLVRCEDQVSRNHKFDFFKAFRPFSCTICIHVSSTVACIMYILDYRLLI